MTCPSCERKEVLMDAFQEWFDSYYEGQQLPTISKADLCEAFVMGHDRGHQDTIDNLNANGACILDEASWAVLERQIANPTPLTEKQRGEIRKGVELLHELTRKKTSLAP